MDDKYIAYAQLSPLDRLKLWVDMPISEVKEYYEFDSRLKYPDSFISEQETEIYENNNN